MGLLIFILGLALGISVSPWFFFVAAIPIFVEITYQSNKTFKGVRFRKKRRARR